MAEITFPYTMHCRQCAAKLKITKKEQIGTKITCPRCQARIEVITPDEDPHFIYGVGEAPPPPEIPDKPSKEVEEELNRKKRAARWKVKTRTFGTLATVGYGIAALVLLGLFTFFIARELTGVTEPDTDPAGDGLPPVPRGAWVQPADPPTFV